MTLRPSRFTLLLVSLLSVTSMRGGRYLAAAEPQWTGVFPWVCQQGETIEITLSGSDLDESTLHFARDGFSVEPIGKAKFRVTAPADAALGDCDLWIATEDGVAGPRRFSVTPYPVIAEKEDNDNDAREQAQHVSLPSVIAGRLDKAADLDWFAFEGEAAQSISIRCRSLSLDGSVQPVLSLYGPDGRLFVYSRSDDLEPQFSCQLPATGTYQLLVRDRAYRKDDFSLYQLELSTKSDSVPASRLHGAVIHPDDWFGGIDLQEEREEPVAEVETMELPFRMLGRFRERNEVDRYGLQAEKGQVIRIEAFGERLGQLMDLEIDIYDADGKLVTTAGDLEAPQGIPASFPVESLDPALDWTVPADGEYTLAVRDLYGGSVFGPDRVYQLIAEVQRPRFLVAAMPSLEKAGRGVLLEQGESAELPLIVLRTGGFEGAVTVRLDEPASGITMEPAVLDGNENTSVANLSAADDAPTGFRTIRLVAEAAIDSDSSAVPVVYAVQPQSGAARRCDEMIIYVGE